MDTNPDKSSIPKFASFKPKPAPDGGNGPAPKQSRTREHVKHHDSDNKPTTRRKRPHHRHRSAEPTSVTSTPTTDNEYFVADGKGDPNIVTYGRLYKYHVPHYRRRGYGSVLGLDSRCKIQRDNEGSADLEISAGYPSQRQGREILKKNLRFPQASHVAPQQSYTDFPTDQAFIPLSRLGSGKRTRTPDIDRSHGQSLGLAFSQESSDTEKEVEGDELVAASAVGDVGLEQRLQSDLVKSRNKELTEKTRKEPNNIEAWMDLAHHQAAMLRLGQDCETLSSAERHNLAEIRIAIFKQAIKAVEPAYKERDRLVNRYLDEGSRVWDTQTLHTEWSRALKAHRSSAVIWKNFLEYAQSNFTGFQYDLCKAHFLDILQALLPEYDGHSTVDTSYTTTEELQTHMVLRLTLLMRDSGYEEQAIASWQALLEFYIFRPSLPTNGAANHEPLKQEYHSRFQTFWESEVPRIGEVGSKGWAAFAADPASSSCPEPISDIPSFQINQETCFDEFSRAEMELTGMMRWPGRSMDESRDDDPYHVVLYSDLHPVLQALPLNMDSLLLIEAFLSFCGMPSLAFDAKGRQMPWTLDSLVRSEKLQQPGTESVPQYFQGVLAKILALPMKNTVNTQADLFTTVFDTVDDDNPYTKLVGIVLGRLTSTLPNVESLAEYYIAFEHKINPPRAAKVAKTCIKRNPSSLRLYSAYALMNRGGATLSDHIVSNALKMASKLVVNERLDSILLWRTWIWNAIGQDDHGKALRLLMSMPDGERDTVLIAGDGNQVYKADASHRLRFKAHLAEIYDTALAVGKHEVAVISTELRALSEYLYAERSIEAVISIFRDAFTSFRNRGLTPSHTEELLHQTYASFFSFHVSTVRLFKPAVLRDELLQSIKAYPNNTYLLSVYAANEARFRIDDRVRSIMHDVVLGDRHQTIVGWAFSIWTEMLRGIELGGTAHAVRAAFESAISDESTCNHSPALWKSYVLFEHGNRDLTRAKNAFFRGLTKLPWCKSYAMLAFTHLADELSFRELKQVYGLLIEKGLRVHVDIEDMLEEIEEDMQEQRRMRLQQEAEVGRKEVEMVVGKERSDKRVRRR